MNRKKLGLIINPIAGMGGRVGLKGTDGLDILQQAKKLGAQPRAQDRAREALAQLRVLADQIDLITYPVTMGEDAALQCGFLPRVVGACSGSVTTRKDTQNAAKLMREVGVDLLLFAGGDGTARDIYRAVGDTVLTLGIPAGVKIHSAVFAGSPTRAGDLAASFVLGKTSRVVEAEVMDLNEEDYRREILTARLCGYLKIPFERRYVQNRKAGTPASERYAQEAIAAAVVESMSEAFHYLVGPGTTTRAIMERFGAPCSLLGVDLVYQKQLIAKDINESEILSRIEGQQAKLIVTPVGGQGYLLGRGNQQISPAAIHQVGKDNVIIVATTHKINALRGRPLLVDTGDVSVDDLLCDYYRIVTGYRESIVYKVAR
ncbi:MAG: ATP-NAD kinase family protein [Planctomycetota bacterium]